MCLIVTAENFAKSTMSDEQLINNEAQKLALNPTNNDTPKQQQISEQYDTETNTKTTANPPTMRHKNNYKSTNNETQKQLQIHQQ